MKKLVIVVVLAAGMCCFGVSQSQAGLTGNIEVTVTLTESVSITVSPDAWAIGAVEFSNTTESPTITATNEGNVNEDFGITGENGAGDWAIQTASGADQFLCQADDESSDRALSAVSFDLFTDVSWDAATAKTFTLKYTAPSSDTKGGGVAQDFTTTVTATKHTP